MSELKVKANVGLVLVAEGKEYPLNYSDKGIFDESPVCLLYTSDAADE